MDSYPLCCDNSAEIYGALFQAYELFGLVIVSFCKPLRLSRIEHLKRAGPFSRDEGMGPCDCYFLSLSRLSSALALCAACATACMKSFAIPGVATPPVKTRLNDTSCP